MIAYPKELVRRTVGRGRYDLGMRDKDLFVHPPEPEEIARQQIERFNRVWSYALTLPFYQKMAAEHRLPAVISHLDQFNDWPILTKNHIRAEADLVWQGMDRTQAYVTSGSTSEPCSFPAGPDDFDPWYSAMWSYRAAAGLDPFDSFGTFDVPHHGPATNRWTLFTSLVIRHAKDILNNSWMFESLPTNTKDLDRQLARIASMRPKFLVGRTNALMRLARRASRTGVLRAAGYAPRYTILTSEIISSESIRVVTEGFGGAVLSEYGSTEFGIIAASPPEATWPMRTVWHSCLLRVGSDSSALVTSLGHRAFPLINYQIGDEITPELTGPGGTVLELGPVKGRLGDFIQLPDRSGTTNSYEAEGLALSVVQVPDVHGVQLVQHEDSVTVLVVAPSVERGDYLQFVSKSLNAAFPEVRRGSIRLAFIDDMIPGARGKQLVMVPEERVNLVELELTPVN